MAHHAAVTYIEQMQPDYVNAVGEECLRTKGILRTALHTLDGMPGTVEWRSDAADLYERRLKESIDLVEGLYEGFDKAGKAVSDYAQAQAKNLVAQGRTAEGRLGALIEPIVATQSPLVRVSDALGQWNDLRSSTAGADWLIELRVQDDIAKVRQEADQLWHQATGDYDDAIRIESAARTDTVARLAAAYRLLPDFLANSPLSAKIVNAAPGLTDTTGTYRIGPPATPKLTFDNDFPYDPNATPTPEDIAAFTKWVGMLRGGQLLRADLDDATNAYSHYLNGSGTDMRVDYEEAYREDPNIRTRVDNEILSAQNEAERIHRETGQTGFEMTGNPSTGEYPSGEDIPYPSTENWQKAIGAHTVYGTSDVVVTGDQITMKIKVHAEDMYNFNKDNADIATGAPDNENGRFSTLGWAQQFRTHGELERTVTWTIGQSPDLSGGTGPERHAPAGEDRADGRSDGRGSDG